MEVARPVWRAEIQLKRQSSRNVIGNSAFLRGATLAAYLISNILLTS